MARGKEKEKRKSKRVPARLALQIEKPDTADGEDVVIAESINLSSSGLYCRLRTPIPVPSKVVITLLIPAFGRVLRKTHVLKCDGIVVRCVESSGDGRNGEYEIACCITNMKRSDKDLVERYVTWKSMRSFLP